MSSHPTKKQRLEDDNDQSANDDALTTAGNLLASFGALSVDELANILGYLKVEEIMRSRCINKKSREAVKITIVPLSDFYFYVNSLERYNAMNVMTRALPNLQQIIIYGLGYDHKYNEGEDADEELIADTANRTTHDIGIISNFSKLRELEIDRDAPLNGRYPFLFSSFPLLQKLIIVECEHLKWDLDMLAGLPLLKELVCINNICLTGNINSLRVLKETLENVTIERCDNVDGNFMDLADFAHLKELFVCYTPVIGDIRDIGENDFLSLEDFILPKSVYGGSGYQFQSIAEATDLVRTLYLLKKQRPALIFVRWHGTLSADSPDWYAPEDEEADSFPFGVHFVKAGSRVGYQWRRWETSNNNRCEVNWLDPEPGRMSCDYGKYFEELCDIDVKVNLFKGFHQPPTEEEFHRLLDEHKARGSDSEREECDDSDEECCIC